jgi:hypothetical protein
LLKFVSSNWFAAKSVEQMAVEQSQFEQFTPTQIKYLKNILCYKEKYLFCNDMI